MTQNSLHRALIDEISNFDAESGRPLTLCRKIAAAARLSVDFNNVPPFPIPFDSKWSSVGSPSCESLCRSILESSEAESSLHSIIIHSAGGDDDPLFCVLFSIWWDSAKLGSQIPLNLSQRPDSSTVPFSYARGLVISLMPTALWTYLSRTLLRSSPRLHDCHVKSAASESTNYDQTIGDGNLVDNVLGIESVLVSCSLYFSCLPRSITVINLRELSSVAHDKSMLLKTPTAPSAQEEDKVAAQKMIASLTQDVAVSRTFENDARDYHSGADGYSRRSPWNSLDGTRESSHLMKTARARVHPEFCRNGPYDVTERTLNVFLVKLMAVFQSHVSRVTLRSSLMFTRCICSMVGFDFCPITPQSMSCTQPDYVADLPQHTSQQCFTSSARVPFLYEPKSGPHIRLPIDDELLVNSLRAVSSCVAHHGTPVAIGASPPLEGNGPGDVVSRSMIRISGVAALKAGLRRGEIEVLPQAVFYALSLLNITE